MNAAIGLGRGVAGGVRGAARLLVGVAPRPSDIAETPDSVLHSFAAALFCLPGLGFSRWLDWRDQGPASPIWHAASVNLGLFVIGWVAFLLLARVTLQNTNEMRAWPRLVAVWNWCNLAQYAVQFLGDQFQLFHAAPFTLNVVGLVSLFWQTWIEWCALRVVLSSPWIAALLLGFDFVLGILGQSLAVSLGG